MVELAVLSLFCGGLLACILFDISILYALGAGLILFFLYGKWKGFSWKELAGMALSGVKTVKNILMTFVLIGMLTALWRDAGTISVIVCYAIQLIRPSIFLLMAFLLNCLISFLTGTAFGTAATMGVICSTMAATMGVNPVLVGGAVLAGAYFGDRCSPVSTSALLVSELTGTSIFCNIRNMVRTAAVPFVVSCMLYLVVGLLSGNGGEVPELSSIFAREFVLSWVALLPAIAILLLSLFRVKVKIAMAVSILVALPISLLVQQTPVSDLPRLLVMGFQAADSEVAAMVNGGGIISMVRVSAIVSLSSSYSGIFKKTGLLDGAKKVIGSLADRVGPYTATLCTATLANMIACNQTLGIMLTHQLCRDIQDDPEAMALNLEDSAVVVAPLVPWSIAGAVSLSAAGAPMTGIVAAWYLYLLPLWRLTICAAKKRK
ncbi:MAG: sodium:proton antiporter [Ruminococcaceae bacterium]|nr:sodium:proton antiporter [Oscillospiraceae bacterium]